MTSQGTERHSCVFGLYAIFVKTEKLFSVLEADALCDAPCLRKLEEAHRFAHPVPDDTVYAMTHTPINTDCQASQASGGVGVLPKDG